MESDIESLSYDAQTSLSSQILLKGKTKKTEIQSIANDVIKEEEEDLQDFEDELNRIQEGREIRVPLSQMDKEI